MIDYEIIPLVGREPVFHNTKNPAIMPITDKNFKKFEDHLPASINVKPMVTAVHEAMQFLLHNTHGNKRKQLALNIMIEQSGIGEPTLSFEQQLKAKSSNKSSTSPKFKPK